MKKRYCWTTDKCLKGKRIRQIRSRSKYHFVHVLRCVANTNKEAKKMSKQRIYKRTSHRRQEANQHEINASKNIASNKHRALCAQSPPEQLHVTSVLLFSFCILTRSIILSGKRYTNLWTLCIALRFKAVEPTHRFSKRLLFDSLTQSQTRIQSIEMRLAYGGQFVHTNRRITVDTSFSFRWIDDSTTPNEQLFTHTNMNTHHRDSLDSCTETK